MAIVTQQLRICDVHRLLDFDTATRLCTYCGLCDAWICVDDQSRWDRRLRAAFKRKVEPDYKGVSNYEEVAVPDPQKREELLNERTGA